jgi:hypothetical protein
MPGARSATAIPPASGSVPAAHHPTRPRPPQDPHQRTTQPATPVSKTPAAWLEFQDPDLVQLRGPGQRPRRDHAAPSENLIAMSREMFAVGAGAVGHGRYGAAYDRIH